MRTLSTGLALLHSGNRWTVPWGLQISKLTHFGSRPANLVLVYYANAEHPEGGPE